VNRWTFINFAKNTFKQPQAPGFTLIELMVTSMILVIMALLLAPALHTAREKARAATCVTNLRACSTALTMYVSDEPTFLPSSLEALTVTGEYLPVKSRAPYCPKDGIPYVYYQMPLIWMSSGSSVNAEDAHATHLGYKNRLFNDGRIEKQPDA
jgi:prepilin-type N-terminal cleavage/methylation domain-containing protein